MSGKLTLHHLNASRSWRILWLLEELLEQGIAADFDIVRYQRNEQTRLAPPELAKVHPLGKAPVLEHDGHVIAESAAIIAYLLGKFDKAFALHPSPENPHFAEYQYWMAATEGAIMLPVLNANVYLPLSGLAEDNPGRQYMNAEAEKVLGFVENHLGGHTYTCGDAFTAADIMLCYVLDPHIPGSGRQPPGPNAQAFVERLKQRPAYARMLAHGI